MTKQYTFFKNSVSKDGELLPFERYTLYSWILKYKPHNIIEIGTGTGGSTQYICEALNENGFGQTYSCDPSRSPTIEFIESRKNNLYFYPITSSSLIELMIHKQINIDFIFFDGPEDPEIALNDLKCLEKYLKNGTLFCMHDWHIGVRGYDNRTSTKSYKIQRYVEESKNWDLVEILKANEKNSDFDDTPYDSVGMCLYRYENQ